MNHIVIDYQQRQQYLMIFVAAIIVSFILGFWFGYHTVSPEIIIADDSYADSEYTAEENPSNLDTDLNNKAENSKPAVSQSVADNKPVTKPAPKPVIAARPAPPVVAPPPRPVVTPPPVVKPVPVTPVNVAPPAVINKPAAVPVDNTSVVAEPEVSSETITNSSLSDAASNTQYTVQAGAFDNRDNAMKLVADLNAKGFDAYAAESINSIGEIKFNVRFGRHSERDLVQKRLARFKQLYTTSAYIIVVEK